MNATTSSEGIALRLALAGAAFGVLDGLAARWAAPGWGLAVPVLGAVVDGCLLGVVGLAWDRWRGRTRAQGQPGDGRRWAAVAVAALVGGLWPDPATRGTAAPADVRPVAHGAAQDVLWIAVDGLRAEDLAQGRLPALAAWSTHATLFRQSWASTDDPDLALQAQRTGRAALDTSGPIAEGVNPPILGLLTALGVETYAVVGGPAASAEGATAIDLVVPWRDGFPAGAHRLLLGRLLGALHHARTGEAAPRAAAPEEVAARAAAALPAADDPARVVFVHFAAPTLPAVDPGVYDLQTVHDAWLGRVDDALQLLLDEAATSARASTLRILVTGTAGVQTAPQPPDGGATLRPDTTHLVTLFRRPGEPSTGGVVDAYVRSEDIGPGVVGEVVNARLDDAFDGRSPFRRLAEIRGGKRLSLTKFDLVPPPDAGTRGWVLPPSRPDETRQQAADPVAWRPALCDLLADRTSDDLAISIGRDGTLVVRQGGYALRTPSGLSDVGGDFELRHDWVDAQERERAIAAASATCGDMPAADRAVAMATAAQAALDAQAERRGSPWPESLTVPVRQRPADAPDPHEILARHGLVLPSEPARR